MATAAKASKAPTPSAGNQLTPPVQVGLILMVVGFVGALYFFLIYGPLEETRVGEVRRQGELETQKRTADSDLSAYNDDVRELEQLRNYAREQQRRLPDNPDIPGFMRSINTLAEASGLSITLIQPDTEQVEQYYARVPVRLEVSGSFLALARFFRSVSQLPRVINMENIVLSDPEEVGGDVRLKARVLATTFRALTSEEVATQRTEAAANARPATPAAAPARRGGGR